MGRMARDVLAVPASGCAVERQFSISRRMTVWQRNHLSPRVISDAMIYKAVLAHTRCPLRAELDNVDDIDQLPIEEKERTIPDEWVTGRRLNKLDSGLPIINMVGARANWVEEDLYARRVDDEM
jgi:hAT family C-terminal dimerisation region